jgi:hypothetical protein
VTKAIIWGEAQHLIMFLVRTASDSASNARLGPFRPAPPRAWCAEYGMDALPAKFGGYADCHPGGYAICEAPSGRGYADCSIGYADCDGWGYAICGLGCAVCEIPAGGSREGCGGFGYAVCANCVGGRTSCAVEDDKWMSLRLGFGIESGFRVWRSFEVGV